jgi:hypothetical protein
VEQKILFLSNQEVIRQFFAEIVSESKEKHRHNKVQE